MKKLIILMLVCMSAQAEEVPSYLKDGIIQVTLKNGKQYSFSTNEYKVVKRNSESQCMERLEEISALWHKFYAEHQFQPSVQIVTAPKFTNRVRLLGGVGPTGVGATLSGNSVNINATLGAIGGVGYDRLLNSRFSVGGQALTNQTYLLNIGFDF